MTKKEESDEDEKDTQKKWNRWHSPSDPRHSQRFLSGFFLLIKHSHPNANQSPPPPRAKGSPGRAWRDGKQTTPGLRGEFLHVRKTNRKKYTYSLIALFSVYLYFITFLRRFLRLLLSRFIFAFIFRLFFIYRFLFFTDCLQNAKACFVPSLVPLFATMPLH